MRLVLLALLVPTLVAATASARPITVGAAMGLTQAKVDANSDPNTTLSVFGRLGFNRHASAQLEFQRIETDSTGTDIRTGTLLVTLDLSDGKHLVPMILAGAGLDSASTTYGNSTDAHHFEGGFALEYRADGGLVVGGDLRIGGRSIDSQSAVAYPTVGVAYFAPAANLSDGEYRSARAYVGIRF
jgi:outer membrane protein with beta-barrel domain